MKYAGLLLAGACAGAMWLAVPAWAKTCPPDSVRVGAVCIDKYEASVWEIPASNKGLINKVQEGKVTLANLQAGGAIPHGASSDDYGDGCPDSGNGCTDFYAVSIPGVLPSAHITWFQAQQACGNAGKRLVRNDEWQMAAADTPDPGAADDGTTTCATNSPGAVLTGSRANCVSRWGVFDMVGNVWERVADWADLNPGCTDWTTQTGLPGNDLSCWGGDDGPAFGFQRIPAVVTRGGSYNSGTDAGVFAVENQDPLTTTPSDGGFRCAR
jgi:sulfatase-modifying factor enzyme 1